MMRQASSSCAADSRHHETKPFSPPEPICIELANGLSVLLVQREDVPLVNLQWASCAGADCDPPGFEGLSRLTTSLLSEGARSDQEQRWTDEAEARGADWFTHCDRDCGAVGIEMLSEDLLFGIEVLSQTVANPALPESALARLRQRQLTQIASRARQPVLQADDLLALILFDGQGPSRPVLGSPESLARIERSHAQKFHQTHLKSTGGRFIAVGDFNSDELLHQLRHCALQELSSPPQTPRSPPRSPNRRQILVAQGKTRNQAHLRMGSLAIRRSHPDFARLQMVSMILGGIFGSRISRQLRQHRGWTYSVRSAFTAYRDTGFFSISTAIDSGHLGESVEIILEQIEELRQEPPQVDEVERAARMLTGLMPRSFETLHGLARWLRQLTVLNLSWSEPRTSQEEILATTAEQLLTLARHYLAPEQMSIVAVGSEAHLHSQLARFGTVGSLNSQEIRVEGA